MELKLIYNLFPTSFDEYGVLIFLFNIQCITDDTSSSNVVTRFFKGVGIKYQLLLDRSTPHTKGRWVFALVMVLLFVLRILLAQVSMNFIHGNEIFTQYSQELEYWISFLVLLALIWKYIDSVNLIIFQGWYIITYALGIYHLNLFIAFLTPKIDPALDYEGKEKSISNRPFCFELFTSILAHVCLSL